MGSPVSAFSFLIETAVHLYLVVILLRILLEAVRADFSNPIVQVLLRLTDPLVKPLSKVIPNIGRVNVSAVVVLYLVQLIGLIVLVILSGRTLDPVLIALLALMRLVRMLLVFYMIMILIGVILSWVGQGVRHPLIPLVYQLVDPVLAPIRRVLPDLGGFDLSPLVAIIGIQFLIILLGL
jgi:YggT family protein